LNIDINTVLQQYHSKFDDNEVRELLEKLEQMMYERASFFHNDNLKLNEESELFEKIDDYWRPFDDLGYGSSIHDEILDKVRDDVTGLGTCGCCKKIGIIKPQVVSSVLLLSDKNKVYLVKLCETCISKKNWCMEYKQEIDKDTPIPSTLSEVEKQLMIQYQTTLEVESS